MQQSPGFALPSATLLMEVDVAPELADIHSQFAPLLRLSGICTVPSAAVSSSLGAGNFSGSDDEEQRGRRSPAASPVRAAESKLAELMAPVSVTLPPPMSSEDVAFFAHYIENYRAKEEAERAYVALIFQEYKKRKSMEQKWESEMEAMRQELEQLRQRELPPEVRAAVENLMQGETAAREAVWAAYGKFIEWVENTTPQWIEAAQRREQARLADEKAKKAAMAAAREALAQELAMGKQLGGSGGNGGSLSAVSAGASSSPPVAAAVAAAAVVNDDGTLSYEPSVSVDQQVAASRDPMASLGVSALRRKAIRMLEAEEEEMKRRREEQVRLLRVQEEQLRAKLALKEQHAAEQAAREEREAAQQREDELAKRYNALLEQEFALQSRVRERAEQEARQEAERQMLMEHVAAEEQLLRQRIQEKEDRRKAAEEEAARVAREAKMREIREQEETLRRRIAERAATVEAEKRVQEEKARRNAEAAAVRAEQEEALRRAKAEQDEAERARQLAYLRDQEEAYKRHLREKELEAIEKQRRAAETHWTHPTLPSSPYVSNSPSLSTASPTPTGSMAKPVPNAPAHQLASAHTNYYPTPQPPVPSYYNPYAVAAPVMTAQPPQPSYAAYPSAYAPYLAVPPQPQPQPQVATMEGYPPPNPMVYYPQSAPYAPTAMYPR